MKLEECIKCSSPAKVNLYLKIISKRDDGYHEIETIMQEVAICDYITCTYRSDGNISLWCDKEGIPTDENNLAVKAAMLLKKECGISAGVDIKLEKNIPSGGGLGGGSANAATVLTTLNKLWGLGLSYAELNRCAAILGSDINFFLYGGTCLCTGRGEKVKPLSKTPELDMVLVFPEWGVLTSQAYKNLNPDSFGEKNLGFCKEKLEKIINAIENNEKSAIITAMYNSFEESVFEFEEREKELYLNLQKLSFQKVIMSGSGSTLAGIAKNKEEAEILAKKCRAFEGVREVVVTQSV
jgi:4-diphosphocytidyl-2-C-methyl-D-erythritol kinase